MPDTDRREKALLARARVVAAAHFNIESRAFELWGNAGFGGTVPSYRKAKDEPEMTEISIGGVIMPEVERAFMDDCFNDRTPVSGQSFRDEMEKAEGDVLIRLNSPGGDVWEMSVIVQAIAEKRNAGHRVDAVIDGLAASAASVIAMACGEVTMSPLGTVMIHKASGAAVGNADDMEKYASVMRGMDESVAKTYAKRTGKDMDEIMSLMADETYMTADQALDQGFVSRIMELEPEAEDAENDVKAKLEAKRNAMYAGIMNSLQMTIANGD